MRLQAATAQTRGLFGNANTGDVRSVAKLCQAAALFGTVLVSKDGSRARLQLLCRQHITLRAMAQVLALSHSLASNTGMRSFTCEVPAASTEAVRLLAVKPS